VDPLGLTSSAVGLPAEVVVAWEDAYALNLILRTSGQLLTRAAQIAIRQRIRELNVGPAANPGLPATPSAPVSSIGRIIGTIVDGAVSGLNAGSCGAASPSTPNTVPNAQGYQPGWGMRMTWAAAIGAATGQVIIANSAPGSGLLGNNPQPGGRRVNT